MHVFYFFLVDGFNNPASFNLPVWCVLCFVALGIMVAGYMLINGGNLTRSIPVRIYFMPL